MPDPPGDISISKPLVYLIRVAGKVDPDFSDYVRGMTVTTDKLAGGGSLTILYGTCPDHSALMGILTLLGNLGLPIISVECLGSPSEETGQRD